MRLEVDEYRVKASMSDPRERQQVEMRRKVTRETGSEKNRLRSPDLRPLSCA
jgi:hypothetical protein